MEREARAAALDGVPTRLRRPILVGSRGVERAVRLGVVSSLAAGIFLFDLVAEPQVAVALLYVPIVILAMWLEDESAPLYVGATCSLLALGSWGADYLANAPSASIVNQLLIVVAVASSGGLCFWRNRAEGEVISMRGHLDQLKKLMDGIDLPIIVADMKGRVRFSNRNAEHKYGYGHGEMISESVGRLFPISSGDKVREVLQRSIAEGVSSVETTRIAKHGQQIDVRMTAIPLPDAHGDLSAIAIVDRDRTQEVKMLRQMQELALYDSLTSLPNRRCFYERLDSALAFAERNDWMLALLFFDLDGFKKINDSLGHGAGDRLLCTVSERLMSCVRRSDYVGRGAAKSAPETTISRLGGDEFTVILTEIRDSNDAARTAKRMLEAVSAPIELDGHEVSVSSSVGIAICPYDGGDAETLIRNADTAMYHAKELGPGRCSFYSEAMNEKLKRRLDLAGRLRHALDQNHLSMHYQPVYRTEDGLPTGAELLLRWADEEIGEISPAEFIPIAEETGLIDRIGEWVLRSACQWAASWARAGHRPLSVAVNVSTHQLRLETLTGMVRDALLAARLEPHLLTLEITESAVMDESGDAAQTIEQLRELGVRIALDDFGTGYSSLSRLRRLRLDSLKIDRSFISEIGQDQAATELVAAIIAMAHTLRLRVVAEGVETREQLEFLHEHSCDSVQGYLMSRPVDGCEFERMMAGIGELPRWAEGIPEKM